MLTLSATHRGAPFVGRQREIGILTHLLEEGLAGERGLILVAGESGVGRRRLLAETLRRGPDAEWIHLAPGGVEADLTRWVQSELVDLFETYPDTPQPSWALHQLSRFSGQVGRRASVKALSREPLPAQSGPEVIGSAIGAVLQALTGSTLIIVDAGLWPESGHKRRALDALVQTLSAPGTVMLAATSPREVIDTPTTRTLALLPLDLPDFEDLFTSWTGNADTRALAGWFQRVTGGHPFFLHEVVRWLEEMGHLRVDEDAKRVEFLDPVDRLPVPLYMNAVMDARYQRLSPESARLLHLLSQHDGRREVEAIRTLFHTETDEFDEALSLLRRREFLLHRTSRRPLALSSPLWKSVVNRGIIQFSRYAFRQPSPTRQTRRKAKSVLAKTLDELKALSETASGTEMHTGLARIRRRVRGRLGPSWNGVRGRLAILVAHTRDKENRPAAALLWARWGRHRLSPAVHPGLRRSLLSIEVRILEETGRSEKASGLREQALKEALDAGHFLSAAHIRAAVAEGNRRVGNLALARTQAKRAEKDLLAMGLHAMRILAAYTRISSWLDARELEKAEGELRLSVDLPEVEYRLERLRYSPPLPAFDLTDEGQGALKGWGWGLDRRSVWLEARRFLGNASSLRQILSPAKLKDLETELKQSGLKTALADLIELDLLLNPSHRSDRPTTDARLEEAYDLNLKLAVPDRNRFLAQALRDLGIAGAAVYQTRFRPLLVRPVVSPRPRLSDWVRLYLLGRPRVERPDATWPEPFWPEWWRRLWVAALNEDLDPGGGLLLDQANRLIQDSVDAPEEEMTELLARGNELLHGSQRIRGGLYHREGRVVVNWEGLRCDVREVQLADASAARSGDPDKAFAYRVRGLSWITGPLLPGIDEDPVNGLRARMTAVTKKLLGQVLDGSRPISADERITWLEGCAASTDLSEWTERLREMWPETPPGSPSREV